MISMMYVANCELTHCYAAFFHAKKYIRPTEVGSTDKIHLSALRPRKPFLSMKGIWEGGFSGIRKFQVCLFPHRSFATEFGCFITCQPEGSFINNSHFMGYHVLQLEFQTSDPVTEQKLCR